MYAHTAYRVYNKHMHTHQTYCIQIVLLVHRHTPNILHTIHTYLNDNTLILPVIPVADGHENGNRGNQKDWHHDNQDNSIYWNTCMISKTGECLHHLLSDQEHESACALMEE